MTATLLKSALCCSVLTFCGAPSPSPAPEPIVDAGPQAEAACEEACANVARLDCIPFSDCQSSCLRWTALPYTSMTEADLKCLASAQTKAELEVCDIIVCELKT